MKIIHTRIAMYNMHKGLKKIKKSHRLIRNMIMRIGRYILPNQKYMSTIMQNLKEIYIYS